MSDKRGYYAIIPANVRYDDRLIPNAKLLYGEITALCNEKGYCWASNQYFADLYKKDKSTISKWISQLNKSDYIKIEIKYKKGTKEIEHRYIRIRVDPMDENEYTPMDEKPKDNNTVLFNNTFNNTLSSESKKDISFNRFWKIYDKSKDKEKCKKKWNRISKVDKIKIFETLPEYVSLTPDKQYRKNPHTYLNGKNWNDDLSDLKQKGKQPNSKDRYKDYE